MPMNEKSWDCGRWLDLLGVHPHTQQKSALKKRLLAVLKWGPGRSRTSVGEVGMHSTFPARVRLKATGAPLQLLGVRSEIVHVRSLQGFLRLSSAWVT